MVKARWAARQRAGLPDAREWSTALALAVIQTLLGPASSCPSHSLKMCPSDGQSAARAERYGFRVNPLERRLMVIPGPGQP